MQSLTGCLAIQSFSGISSVSILGFLAAGSPPREVGLDGNGEGIDRETGGGGRPTLARGGGGGNEGV